MTTDWETHYQSGETPWDKGVPAPGLVARLEEEPLTGSILVPGCGLGHDVRAIAAASPAAGVVGLDVAPSAVERARALPLAGNERYVEADWFALPDELAGVFDWVWEHTCFCAIPLSRRDDYVAAADRALKPGGKLLGVFYLDPYDEEHRPEDDRPPHGTTREELETRFADRFEVVSVWEPEQAYAGREGREVMMILRKK